MGFKRGAAAIREARTCPMCLEGRHSECLYLQMIFEMNHGAWDHQEYVYVSSEPYCWCYAADEDRHDDYEQDEDRKEDMTEPDERPAEAGLSLWSSWEAVVRPFPGVITTRGYDEMLTQVADVVHDSQHRLPRRWGDVHLAGTLDRDLTLEVDTPVPVTDLPFLQGRSSIQEFQRDVADLMRELGIEGTVHAEVVYNVMREDG